MVWVCLQDVESLVWCRGVLPDIVQQPRCCVVWIARLHAIVPVFVQRRGRGVDSGWQRVTSAIAEKDGHARIELAQLSQCGCVQLLRPDCSNASRGERINKQLRQPAFGLVVELVKVVEPEHDCLAPMAGEERGHHTYNALSSGSGEPTVLMMHVAQP